MPTPPAAPTLTCAAAMLCHAVLCCAVLQLMFLMLIVSVVFNVVKGALGSGSSSSNKKNQDW
jgi:hypothetical protein